MVLKILRYPHPLLRQRSDEVEKITPEILDLCENMVETMIESMGIGLSAVQVGKPIQILTILNNDVNNLITRETPAVVMINPKIVREFGPMIVKAEGCLSFPGKVANKRRSKTVEVRYTDRDGKTQEVRMSDLHARIFFHEYDHFFGRLLFNSK
jgi:peptide deformylase